MELNKNDVLIYLDYEIKLLMKNHSLSRYEAIDYLHEDFQKMIYHYSYNIAEFYSDNENKFYESEIEVFEAISLLVQYRKLLKCLKIIMKGEDINERETTSRV